MRHHFVPLTFVAMIAIGQLGCQPPVASTQQSVNGRTSQLKPREAPLLNEAVFFEQLDEASLGEAAGPAPLDPHTEINSEPCPRKTHEDLDATLWMQTSAEYYATCRQTYRLAATQLQNAIDDPTWSADLVQQSALAESTDTPLLPTAVILDIDETVLDNSPYQARLIQTDEAFTPESWQRWVEEAAAEPIPGVHEFLTSAEKAGVEVFFVTNRENAVENATRRNLEKLDLIQVDASDRILSKRERDEWTSDKATRRAHIAKRYRILLLIGDDLNDFVSIGNKPTAQARREIAVEHAEMWGVKWMQLPNANYGGWERSIYDWNDSADDEVKLRQKYDALNNASAE
ncbi:5'-nucleotidase, lipoprotein e(P4) family [Rhodopirellula sp. SWK7]|uniref:5'-nucleotidase, lipoprotein e(P4) family n=1 Tax=Rhodopirellula sp. SWK7 TaxID=595460 RepID=UPI0002BD32DC|nr:HAD family acid phosphatase [Rhodopirellula sp. SWK7]EMI40349.1 5-nucleotidase lipoprotein e(P4) [Rhodopirellula sp. SWK7]